MNVHLLGLLGLICPWQGMVVIFAGTCGGAAFRDNVPARYVLWLYCKASSWRSLSYSASSYHEAESLEAVVFVEEKMMPTVRHILVCVEQLERVVLACCIFATMQYSKVTHWGGYCFTSLTTCCRTTPWVHCAACSNPCGSGTAPSTHCHVLPHLRTQCQNW